MKTFPKNKLKWWEITAIIVCFLPLALVTYGKLTDCPGTATEIYSNCGFKK